MIQEGRLLARVRHPNIVTVYGAERVGGQVGVWMEFVHGKTLEEELRDARPFDVDRVIRIGIELSGALSTVHRAGLIHRDVKAQNVLCDRDGRLVLTDFGAGCELEEETDDKRASWRVRRSVLRRKCSRGSRPHRRATSTASACSSITSSLARIPCSGDR